MTPKLTIGWLEENLDRLLTELDRDNRILRDFTRSVARSYMPGFYVYGPAGTGKTHTVCEVLDRDIKTPYVYKRGHVTPIGLYELLGANADEIVVLDDMGDVFGSDVARQILLGALEQPKPGRPRRITYKRKGEEFAFEFRGGLIAISNLKLHDAKLLKALKSRVVTLGYDPPAAQLAALMLDVARKGRYPGSSSLSVEKATQVARYVISETLRLETPMDLRLFIDKALPLYRQAEDDEAESHWEDLVTAAIKESAADTKHEAEAPRLRAARIEEETKLAVEIYNALPDHKARIEAWEKKTGKSARAFYRRLEKAQCS